MNKKRILFDSVCQRLLYLNKSANSEFWDQHWAAQSLACKNTFLESRFVKYWTEKYLRPPARVLEGGCGMGDAVWTLHNSGYITTGIDYAERTVRHVRGIDPSLDIQVGDVRKIHFPDNTFDGYWSLGVIEHFYDGFQPLLDEMRRVIKGGGVLFLTVPFFSGLRRILARAGFFPPVKSFSGLRESFYQYAYSREHIVREFQTNGFSLLHFHTFDGLKGFKDDLFPSSRFLQQLYNNGSYSAFMVRRILNLLLDILTPHVGFYVFIKNRKYSTKL